MAIPIVRALPVPSSVAAGAPVFVGRFMPTKVVQFVDPGSPAFSGAVSIQVSNDGTNFVDDVVSITDATKPYVILVPCQSVRINTTTYVEGTLTATISGHRE